MRNRFVSECISNRYDIFLKDSLWEHRMIRTVVVFLTAGILALQAEAGYAAAPKQEDVLAAMKKASAFMADSVSTHGGYVYSYTEDLTKRWGEIPARETQIWCQPPGTPAMGDIFLKAYKITGDEIYRRYAEMAADALVWGQHPEGGWHYLIDFDMTGIKDWYDKVASKCWGWEEYYHYYSNCTYDDDSSTAPTEYLLDLYMTTLDPRYRTPLLKALEFILTSQYPNGGWPQRYPLMYDYPHDGIADYTHYYTFNDGVMKNNIMLLYKAWERLGDERYRDAAVRGMDFYIASQIAEPQAGWAQQYTMDMMPGQARTYEPAAVSLNRTMSNIGDLIQFYTMTGDRRYLEPIPRAIDWIERSAIAPGNSEYTHTGFYELGTNKPLYYHTIGDSFENFSFRIDNNREGAYRYRRSVKPDIPSMKRRYERYYALPPEEALNEYRQTKNRPAKRTPATPDTVEKILASRDSRGVWITDMDISQFDKGMLEVPPIKVRGIDVSVFISNMDALISYIGTEK